jgi:phage shock protein E
MVFNNKNIYKIVGSLVVFIGVITFGLYSTRCHGAECEALNLETKEAQVFSIINPDFIINQAENNQIILLDVREDSEWDEGYIKGALHLPLGSLNIETTKDIPKDKPLYIYCRSGRRAGEAELKLKELGFDKAKNIGGIIEWQEKGGILVVE